MWYLSLMLRNKYGTSDITGKIIQLCIQCHALQQFQTTHHWIIIQERWWGHFLTSQNRTFVPPSMPLMQDDNARPHRARIVDTFLRQSRVTCLDWPACSPDLNPHRVFWEQLGRAVQRRVQADTILVQLRAILLQARQDVNQYRINRLIHSMYRRCMACIRSHVGYTCY